METQPYEIETYDKPVSDRDTATVYLEWRFGKPMVRIQFESVSTSPQRAMAIAEDLFIKTMRSARLIKPFSEGMRAGPIPIYRYEMPSEETSDKKPDELLAAAARVISGASDVERDEYGECIRVWPKDLNRLKDVVKRLDPSLV